MHSSFLHTMHTILCSLFPFCQQAFLLACMSWENLSTFFRFSSCMFLYFSSQTLAFLVCMKWEHFMQISFISWLELSLSLILSLGGDDSCQNCFVNIERLLVKTCHEGYSWWFNFGLGKLFEESLPLKHHDLLHQTHFFCS